MTKTAKILKKMQLLFFQKILFWKVSNIYPEMVLALLKGLSCYATVLKEERRQRSWSTARESKHHNMRIKIWEFILVRFLLGFIKWRTCRFTLSCEAQSAVVNVFKYQIIPVLVRKRKRIQPRTPSISCLMRYRYIFYPLRQQQKGKDFNAVHLV